MRVDDTNDRGEADRFKRRVRRAAHAHALAVAMVLFGVPLLLPHSGLWALAVIPVALLSNSYWAILHEAVHSGLGRSSAENDRLGRLLAILFGSAFGMLRVAHLGHHQFNRHAHDRPDSFEPARTAKPAAFLRYYWGMFFGLYLGEVAGPLACLLPKPLVRRGLRRAFLAAEPGIGAYTERAILEPRTLRQIRLDGILAVAVLACSFWAYGAWWPVLAGFVVTRGFLVGFVDNLYHYGTPLDDRRFAWNLALPRWASLLVLYGNMHRQHHRHPGLAWYKLPRAFASQKDDFDAGFLSMAVRQMKGPMPVALLPRGGGLSPSL